MPFGAHRGVRLRLLGPRPPRLLDSNRAPGLTFTQLLHDRHLTVTREVAVLLRIRRILLVLDETGPLEPKPPNLLVPDFPYVYS